MRWPGQGNRFGAELTVFVGIPGGLCAARRMSILPGLAALPKVLTHVIDGCWEEIRPEKLVRVQIVRQTPTVTASDDR